MNNSLKQIFTVLVQESDSQETKQAKESLIAISVQDPQTFVTELLNIYKESLNEKAKILIISHLSTRICDVEKNVVACIWPELSSELQEQIKLDLFQILCNEQMDEGQLAICDCIGKLAASLLREKRSLANNKWRDFFPKLWQLFQQSDLLYSSFGFRIITIILLHAPSALDGYTEELKVLFLNGLIHPNSLIATSSIDCFCVYIGVTDEKLTTELGVHVPRILESYYYQSQTNQNAAFSVLKSMTDLAIVDSKIFKGHFEMILSAIWKVNIEQQVKIQTNLLKAGIKLVVSVVEQFPSIVRKNKEYLTKLIDLILLSMVEIDEDIIESWKNPEEGFRGISESDSDFQPTLYCISAIDQLIYTVGDKTVYPILFEKMQVFLAHSDWRYQFSAIMVLSQVSEYIKDIETVKQIMGSVLPFIENENPMIRYSVFQLIGQFSDDMNPKFQQAFKSTMTNMLLKYFDDPVPRVASHAAAALINFLEGFEESDIQEFLEVIITKNLAMIDQEKVTSLMKENCLANIAQSGSSAKESLNPYVDRIMESLFRIFITHAGDQTYSQLRGQVIEGITMISQHVNRNVFLPHLNGIISNISKIQNQIHSKDDPSLEYVVCGWKRLVLEYSEEMKPYLPTFMDGFLNMLKLHTVFIGNEEATMKESQMDLILSTLKEFINVYTKNTSNEFNPYAEKTLQVIFSLWKLYGSDLTMEIGQPCVNSLVNRYSNNKDMLKKLLRVIYTCIGAAASRVEEDIFLRIQEQKLLNLCLKNINSAVFSQTEIEYLVHFAVKVLLYVDNELKSKSEKDKNDKANDEEVEFEGNGSDGEDEEISVESNDDDEKTEFFRENMLVIYHVEKSFGALFQMHSQVIESSVKYILEGVLPKVFQPIKGETLLSSEVGLMLIKVLIETFGVQTIGQSQWEEFVEPLVLFCSSEVPRVRQYAARVIEMYAIRTPKNVFGIYLERFVQALWNGAKYGEDNNQITKDDAYYSSFDQMVLSMSIIIAIHAVESHEVIKCWIGCLPLKRLLDRKEDIAKTLANVVMRIPEIFNGDEATVMKANQILQSESHIVGNNIQEALLYLKSRIDNIEQNTEEFSTITLSAQCQEEEEEEE